MPADREVSTGRKCVPDAISERGDDAAGRRSKTLGAITTRGFLQCFALGNVSSWTAFSSLVT